MITPDPKDQTVLSWLQRWYAERTDGEWEHAFGIEISTLDNPGWYIKIDLKNTALEGVHFDKVEVERPSDDWVHCSVDDGVFKGACGPENLTELINHFRGFAESSG